MFPLVGNGKLKYMKQKIGLLLSGFLLLAITTWSQNQQANNNDSLFVSAAAQEKFNAGVGAFEKQDFTSAVTAFSEAIEMYCCITSDL